MKIITSGTERKISTSYSVFNLLTADDSDNVSVALSVATNHEEITKTISDRVYYILEGELTVNDKVVKRGELVFISGNEEYSFGGSFKALLINSPPFKKTNETISKINNRNL